MARGRVLDLMKEKKINISFGLPLSRDFLLFKKKKFRGNKKVITFLKKQSHQYSLVFKDVNS